MSLPESNFEAAEFEEAEGEAPAAAEVRTEAPRGVLVRRPKTNIYSVLLGISAGALAIGCLLMILEIWHYGPPWSFPWKIPTNLR